MNTRLQKFKIWYESSNMRERLLICGLSWMIIYALFNYVLLSPLENKKIALEISTKVNESLRDSWQQQITALNSVMHSGLFKEWEERNRALQLLKTHYHLLLQTSPNQQWQNVIKTILSSHPNITLDQIKYLPESIYSPGDTSQSASKIYRQQLLLTFNSNYFSTLNYITEIEKTLPYLHWDTLTYHVEQYPNAKIDLELSIFYEKS